MLDMARKENNQLMLGIDVQSIKAWNGRAW